MAPMISTFSFPNRIIFGPGALSQLPDLVREQAPTSVCVVTDKGLIDAGIATRAIDLLDSIVTTTLFDGVTPNPDIACVEAAASHLRDHETDLVIGLGGGSAMDTAKAAALRLNHDSDLTRYEIQIGGDRHMTEAIPPVIAIPTTAGTGSEVGRSAVVTLRPANRKAVLCGPKLLPLIALCDPELTCGLPPHITAATGMDALTHNIEAYLSTAFHPVCDAIALGGVRRIAQNLRTAVQDGQNIDARSEMLLASSMGAIAFQKDLGAAHALAHPLSTIADLPHGLANAILLPHVMTYNKAVAASRLKDIAQALGCPTDSVSPESAADLATEAVRSLAADIDIPKGLSAVGVRADQISALVAQAIVDPNLPTNPRPCTETDLHDLYTAAM
jgi:4-hydroxybutyrate dehydrogenase